MTVSLCLIAKNEAPRIGACLDSVRSLVREMVVVDTGSTDSTREIARARGARIVDFPWCDDFAAARNETIRHASQPWIFWMDADDRVDEPNASKLARLFTSPGEGNAGYRMQQVSLGSGGRIVSSIGQVRLFRNDPRIRWDHRVHEQIGPSIEDSGGTLVPTDVVVYHHGYVSPEELKQKAARNLRLLDLEASERPLDPVTQFHRGWALAAFGRLEEAIVALNLGGPGLPEGPLRTRAQGLLARCYFQTGARAEAMRILAAARIRYEDDVDLLHTDAQLRTGVGDFAGAEACLRRILAPGRPTAAECMDSSVLGAKGFYHLGLVCALQGKHAEAGKAAQQATRLDPALLPAWLIRADALAEQGKLQELEDLAREAGAPDVARVLVQTCALVYGGVAEAAKEKLRSAACRDHALIARALAWVEGAPARGSRGRLLDLLRV